MGKIVIGKPNCTHFTKDEFISFVSGLIDSEFCSLEEIEASTDCVFQNDLLGKGWDANDFELGESIEEKHYDEFKELKFASVDELAEHYTANPHITYPIEIDHYNYGNGNEYNGYEVILKKGSFMRGLLEDIVTAARRGNESDGWVDPPTSELSYFAVCGYGLYADLSRCPTSIKGELKKEIRSFQKLNDLFKRVLGEEPEIYSGFVE